MLSGPPPLRPSPQGGGDITRAIRAGISICVALVLAACSQPAGVRDAVVLADEPAENLSDYGFFASANAHAAPSEGVLPYDLVNALFSDYAAKHRLVYVPKGQAAAYNPDKVFDFPVGSVLIKTFAFAPDMREPANGERYIETRLLIHKQQGWVAYPYIWNKEQTEAVYSPVGGRQPIETISPEGKPLAIDYAVPNQNQCKECHSVDDDFVPIGPSARNLNHVGPAGVNQIADWTTHGSLRMRLPRRLSMAMRRSAIGRAPGSTSTAPIATRPAAALRTRGSSSHGMKPTRRVGAFTSVRRRRAGGRDRTCSSSSRGIRSSRSSSTALHRLSRAS